MNTLKTRTPSMTLLDVEAALRERERIGVETYGQTVDRTDFSALQWAYEGFMEALDGALYAMRTIKAIERMERRESLMLTALGEIAAVTMTDEGRKAKAVEVLELLRKGGE
jgi:hypothetical protein